MTDLFLNEWRGLELKWEDFRKNRPSSLKEPISWSEKESHRLLLLRRIFGYSYKLERR